METITLAALALFCLAPAPQGVGQSGTLLTEEQPTEHFQLHYRPESRAGAAVDRVAHELEIEYDETLFELGIRGQVDDGKPFHIYLYDSVEELSRITETGGTGGFSAGRECHMPWDNDQTRKHELVHIVVAAMESTGNEPRNMFFAEGIANAVLQHVHGIPVHAVAAYERERGSLPALQTLVEHPDFYAFLRENPGFNGYDVGGSFFLYLLETYEPKRVMAYYHGQPILEALRKPLAEVEEEWHEKLAAYAIRPALHTLLSRRRGDGGEFSHVLSAEERVPREVLGEASEWRAVGGELRPVDELGEWKIAADTITASNASGADWSIAELPGKLYGDCVLRVQAKVPDHCWGVKLRYGKTCRAMVLGQGVFLYDPGGGIGSSGERRLSGGDRLDLILEVREGHARVFLNGDLALEAEVALEPSLIGLGLVGGTAEFSGFSVRELSKTGPEAAGRLDRIPGQPGTQTDQPETRTAMTATSIAFEVELSASYEDAIEKTTAALAAEGFGILTRIDVKETMKKKLDADFKPYSILGACNPPLAHRALSHSSVVGLMLPCNVTVEANDGGGSTVRIGDPAAFMQVGEFADDPVLKGVADEARARLQRAAAALKGM